MLNKIHEILLAEHERWVLWAPVAVGIGVWLYFQLPLEVTAAQAGKLLGIWFFGGWVMKRHVYLLPLWLVLLLVIVGFTAIAVRTEMLAAPVLERKINFTEVTGHIEEVEPRPQGLRLLLSDVNIEKLPQDKTPILVRVSLKKPPQGLMVGQWVRIKAGLYPPPEKAMPGAFDFARYFYYRRIGAVGYSRSAVEILQEGDKPGWLQSFRSDLTNRVVAEMSGAQGAVVAALLTGERGAIADDVREDMRVAGLAHVLAISGLHLGLVAGIIYFTARFLLVLIPGLAIRFQLKKWAAALALAGAFGYLAVAGFPVSAQRAYVMVALFLFAVIFDRMVTPMRSLAWAALIILLLQPEALLGASFQLSFAATIGIVAFYEAFRDPIHKMIRQDSVVKRMIAYVMGIAVTSLVAGFATAPFIIHDFNQFSSYNLLANLLVSPLVSFWIMPSAVLTFVLMPFGLENWGLALMGKGVGIMLDIARWIHGLPGAFFHIPSLTTWGISLVTLGGLWLTLWQTRWRVWGVIPIMVGMFSIALYDVPSVIISADAKQIAVQDAAGQLVMIRGGRRNFIADQWLEQTGSQAFVKIRDASWNDEVMLRCDSIGCIYSAYGHKVAWAKQRQAVLEDCGNADVIIAGFSIKKHLCPKTYSAIIDYWTLKNHGAYALWISRKGIKHSAGKSSGV